MKTNVSDKAVASDGSSMGLQLRRSVHRSGILLNILLPDFSNQPADYIKDYSRMLKAILPYF